MRRVLGPVFNPITYRRWGYLVLGGVIASPLGLLVVLVPVVVRGPVFGTTVATCTSIVSASLAAATGLLPVTRRMETALARSLLGGRCASLATPLPSHRPQWRGALWFGLHLVVGGVFAILTVLIPLALAATAVSPFRRGVIAWNGWHSRSGWGSSWLPFAGLAGAFTVVCLAAAVGAALARLCPVMLSPTQGERLAALARDVEQLAERNRLAREVHDSIGHALTVTTLQAGTARHLFDTDPEFARQALGFIEETGRAAMTEVDHVVGLLRDAAAPPMRPQPTLAELTELVDTTRLLGVPVDIAVSGPLGAVPPTVSREAYRIVQQGLANAMTHAGPVPVTLRIAVGPTDLELSLTNPLGSAGGATRGGHGLAGMRERVALLRGQITVSAIDGEWRIDARLPYHPAA